MVYRGKVQNGVVVFEGPQLAEGTPVRIEPTIQATPRRGSPEAILQAVGIWAGQEEEMRRSLEILREMKAEEVARQKSEPVPEL